MEQRALREAQERAAAEAQQAEIARLETFVTRFGAKCALRRVVLACALLPGGCFMCAWTLPIKLRASVLRPRYAWSAREVSEVVPCRATKASQAQSRMKQLEKLREAAIPLPAASSGAGPGDGPKVGPGPHTWLPWKGLAAGMLTTACACVGGTAAAQGACLRRGGPAVDGAVHVQCALL